MRYLCFLLCLAAHAQVIATLKPETVREFDAYQATVDQELQQRIHGGRAFQWIDEHPDLKRQASEGRIVTYAISGTDGRAISSGLVHDWVGATYLRGIRLDAVRKVLLDTEHQAGRYPEVQLAKVLSRDANKSVTKLRVVKKKVLTAVLDIEYNNHWEQPAPDRWVMFARARKVVEVDDAGTPKEKPMPPGTGHGFLWRMNSEWALREDAEGVWVELRSVSLSRDTPRGLGWIIRPMIRNLPADTLLSTMQATRAAVTPDEQQ